ncbi:uncharacterized protein LOC115623091 [Scaptodrosophila lebanonensis]|uniref:Uncharacterized protein LOC115623091 n=1 Tax=Drosophila lebanonensis TaxID=7225 RepID=A0A6J2TDF6_DROLE|nr:uncharacterized protein LOC115623091 [Scaptodrosophila lebanonensis]
MAVNVKHSSKTKPKARSKATPVPLSSFLASNCAEQSQTDTIQVTKVLRTDLDHEAQEVAKTYELPTAPRAVRALECDQNIPLRPPYVAFINNLPFDAGEQEVRQLFSHHGIRSLRLPRDDRSHRRTRGFAYVELETREELIALLKEDEPICRGRRLRIEVSNENERARYTGGGVEAGDSRWSQRPSSAGDGPPLIRKLSSELDHDVTIDTGSETQFPMLKSKTHQLELDTPGSATELLPPSSEEPLSEEELQERMHLRLQKLAEFENAQSSQNSDEVDDAYQCWRDFWQDSQSH